MNGLPMHIPTLETERLVLRPPRAADWPAFAAMFASDRSSFMGGPLGTRDAWGVFCHCMANWGLFGRGTLFIERKDTGETVGEVDLNDGPLFPETELGWSLFDGHEGRGYATEAAHALREWAYANTSLTTLVSYTHPANLASQAVAQRLGATLDADAPRQDPEDLVWRHPGPAR